MDPTPTLDTVRTWPVGDQLDLLFRLWDQLVEQGWQPEPTDELAAELDRRVAAHEADPETVRTWEQILKRVRRPRPSDRCARDRRATRTPK